MGEKGETDARERLFILGKAHRRPSICSPTKVKQSKGCAHLIRPMYAQANVGHPSYSAGLC